MGDAITHNRSMLNGMELLEQVKRFDLDLDVKTLEDIVYDAGRVVEHASALLELCRARRVDSVDALIAVEGSG